jgi:hypothetical protein
MSAPAAFPLRYVLPTTAITLSATLRLAVFVDPQGGHLEPEMAVRLSAPWHPQPFTTVRRVLPTSDSPLSGSLPAYVVPGSLRKSFDRQHPRTAALIADLSARSEQYLAGLRMGEESEQVVTFGRALEVVHRELAAADRTRREWVSRQGREIRTAEWDLTGKDVVTLARPADTLPGDIEIPAGRATEMARDYGLLVAIWTDRADDGARGRSESAGIGVYRRIPDTLPDHPGVDPEREWVRDEGLSRLRLADVADPVADIPHQRGGASPDSAQAIPLLPHLAHQDPALEAAVRAARTELELLDCSDEYSRLASTQYRDAEIAALQHEMRLAYMPRQRQGD